jgi:hypothetical protein
MTTEEWELAYAETARRDFERALYNLCVEEDEIEPAQAPASEEK